MGNRTVAIQTDRLGIARQERADHADPVIDADVAEEFRGMDPAKSGWSLEEWGEAEDIPAPLPLGVGGQAAARSGELSALADAVAQLRGEIGYLHGALDDLRGEFARHKAEAANPRATQPVISSPTPAPMVEPGTGRLVPPAEPATPDEDEAEIAAALATIDRGATDDVPSTAPKPTAAATRRR